LEELSCYTVVDGEPAADKEIEFENASVGSVIMPRQLFFFHNLFDRRGSFLFMSQLSGSVKGTGTGIHPSLSLSFNALGTLHSPYHFLSHVDGLEGDNNIEDER